jgi:hypothetical protein
VARSEFVGDSVRESVRQEQLFLSGTISGNWVIDDLSLEAERMFAELIRLIRHSEHFVYCIIYPIQSETV